MNQNRTSYPRKQHGVTLVEMMIAMAIGLFMTAIIAGLYINMRGGYSQQEEYARLQENARFAMAAITRDIRMAGYTGCGDVSCFSNLVNPSAVASDVPLRLYSSSIQGYPQDGFGVDGFPKAIKDGGQITGDALILLGIDSSSEVLVKAHNTTTASFDTGVNDFQPGEILLASDGNHASMFQVTGPAGATKTSVLHEKGVGSPGNCETYIGTSCGETPMAYQYKPGSSLTRVYSNAYYIAASGSGSGNSLYALRLTGQKNGSPVPTELIDGVQNMALTYGVGDGSVERSFYADGTAADGGANLAGLDWSKVLSVTVSLLIVTEKDNIASSPQTYEFNGEPITATDRRLYKVFTETIAVRNRAA